MLPLCNDGAERYERSTGSERTHVSIFSDIPQELFGLQTNTERVEESGRKPPLLISQGFSHGRRPESRGRKWDGWWLTEENENKQRQLSNWRLDWRLQRSADKVCVLSPQRSCGGYSWGGKVYWMTFKWWLQWKSPYSCSSMWTSRWKWFLNTMQSLLFNEMEHLKYKWWMQLSSGPRSFHISFFNRIDSCLLTYLYR